MRIVLLLLFLIFSTPFFCQRDSTFVRSIYNEALENGEAYHNLRILCKDIGARLTGSAEAEMAVTWGERLLSSYGFDKVYLQEIQVPHWERGTKEAAWIEDGQGIIHKINIVALGHTVGTNGMLTGEVVQFDNIEELKVADRKEVEGKIVFLNNAFDQKYIKTFKAYGACYPQRGDGAIEGGRLGAKAVVIRSLASSHDDFPHTGTMRYDEDVVNIPAAAMSTNDANVLSDWLKKGKVNLKIEMDCRMLPDVTSYNVIAEINGMDDKIITWGGHLDSWDVGEGAHDDGAGIVHSIEALRILKKLGYKPKHTLRCVLFMNEENGNMGGKTYAAWCKENKEDHIAALETDRGGFMPIGFDISGSNDQVEFVQQFKQLLYDFQLFEFSPGYSGVDIRPLLDQYPDMIQLGMTINSQEYFDYHHSDADVFEAINKRELELGAAAMATMVYLLDQHLK